MVVPPGSVGFEPRSLPGQVRPGRAFRFVLVPFGATTAGYFVPVFLVVWHACPRRERSAYRAVAATLLAWFVLDTGLSAYHRA